MGLGAEGLVLLLGKISLESRCEREGGYRIMAGIKVIPFLRGRSTSSVEHAISKRSKRHGRMLWFRAIFQGDLEKRDLLCDWRSNCSDHEEEGGR